MGMRPIIETFHLVDSQSMASSITSDPIEIKYMDNVGVQLQWTGSPVGTLSVQVSADFKADTNGNVLNPGQWTDLPLSPPPQIINGPPIYVDINQISSPYLRVKYTATSGSGVLDAFVFAKMV